MNKPVDIFCCAQMSKHLHENEVAITYNPKFRSFAIKVLDGGGSVQSISFCPWCGSKLPEDLSEKFFNELSLTLSKDATLFDIDNAPDEFKTDEWWKKREL